MIKSSILKLLEKYISVRDGTYYTIVDGKAIILIPKENSFYNLNSVGTRMWELSDGSLTLREIVEIIYKEFDVDKETAISDAIKFIINLSKMHLICLSRKEK